MKFLSALVVLLATVVVASGAIPDFVVPGKCPEVGDSRQWAEQVRNFRNFSGTWYEFALTEHPFQSSGDCVRIDYKFDGKQFQFTSTGINTAGRQFSTSGSVYPNPLGAPHLNIDIDDSFSVPHYILDTDYENYACIYSCVDFKFGQFTDIAAIMGRYPYLTSDFVHKCQAAFNGINIDSSRFTKTQQGYPCLYDQHNVY